jgi:hypothetical protein
MLPLFAAVSVAACAARTVGGPASTSDMLAPSLSVRVNVINFTSAPAPFIFRFGGLQLMDSIAPPGTLSAPVISRTLTVEPGTYDIQLLDRRTNRVSRASLVMAESGSRGFATLELIFDEGESRVLQCYCARMYR